MSDSVAQNGAPRLVTLVRGVMEQGGFYWCYLAVKPDLINKFQQAVKDKYNIQNFVKDAYGEVVVSGRGKEPPAEITKKVEEMFKVNFQQIEEGNSDVIIAKMLAIAEAANSAK